MRDYFSEVPRYKYELPCGATVFYRTPVPVGEYGYCQQHKHYFVNDGGSLVHERAPRNARRRLADMEVASREDEAIIRNRIQAVLQETDSIDVGLTETDMKMVADITDSSVRTVYRVAADLGMTIERRTKK